jgi:hypothetical protein
MAVVACHALKTCEEKTFEHFLVCHIAPVQAARDLHAIQTIFGRPRDIESGEPAGGGIETCFGGRGNDDTIPSE